MTAATRLLALTGAVLLTAAAPAAAAPDRTLKAGGEAGGPPTTQGWTSGVHAGAAVTAEIMANAGSCVEGVTGCDTTLVEITDPGKFTASITGVEPTLVDADLYLYRSDATGKVGDLLASSTAFAPAEQVAASANEPGFYLVQAIWSLGAGSIAGSLKFTPRKPPVVVVP